MIALSANTERLVEHLFAKDKCAHIKERLVKEVSENIPFCENSTPEQMERIRFSVLRLIHEGRMNQNDIIKLAQRDVRDLFMVAGHGEDTAAHTFWAQNLKNS
jgi:DNA-directed RNA polymerase alpha subunit